MKSKILKLMSIEFNDTYRFPVLECMIAVLAMLLLPTNPAMSGGPSISFIEKFGAIPIVYRILFYNSSTFFENCFALQILIIPIIISFRVSRSIESGEVETLLLTSATRFDILVAKLFTHLSVNFVLFMGLFILWEALRFPTLFIKEDWVAMAVIMFTQITYVTSLSLLISVIFRRTMISAILSVVTWYVLRLSVEFGWIPKPFSYMIPYQLTRLLFVLLLYYVKGFPYPDAVEILGEPVGEVPVLMVLSCSILIIVAGIVVSFIIFCKLIEFKR